MGWFSYIYIKIDIQGNLLPTPPPQKNPQVYQGACIQNVHENTYLYILFVNHPVTQTMSSSVSKFERLAEINMNFSKNAGFQKEHFELLWKQDGTNLWLNKCDRCGM